jgi:hypothetical protein
MIDNAADLFSKTRKDSASAKKLRKFSVFPAWQAETKHHATMNRGGKDAGQYLWNRRVFWFCRASLMPTQALGHNPRACGEHTTRLTFLLFAGWQTRL